MRRQLFESKWYLVTLALISLATSIPSMAQDRSYPMQRQMMIEEQIVSRGVTDPGVVKAMAEVPRHAFVPDRLTDHWRSGPVRQFRSLISWR